MSLSVPKTSLWSALLLVAAGLTLAWEPVTWLVNTWLDPSYDSLGAYVYVLVVALFLWSATSSRVTPPSAKSRRVALGLLLATALIRLLGRLLAVNVIGAVALVVDVYALGLYAGLDRRARALAPGWLAVAFAFSLPLERMLQRVVGYSLQRLAAGSACSVLDLSFGDVACLGTRIVMAGRDVQVDLPCSGARGLLQLLLLFTLVAALKRPRQGAACAGFALTVAAGFVVNTLRIAMLAVGLAWPERVFGLNVMAEPWHDGIGLLALTLGAFPVLAWVRLTKASALARGPESSVAVAMAPTSKGLTGAARRPGLAAAFAVGAAMIVVVPSRPLDVSRLNHAPILPEVLADHGKEALALSPREWDYFTEFGGGAAKARYGEDTLLLVATKSPLRHLHAPDECLAGSGHEVRFVGTEYTRLPTAVYRSVAPDGQVYRVAVTYVSDDGKVATSVPEVVWHWLKNTGVRWTAIQRISRWEEPNWRRRLFDEAVARSFDLPRLFEEPEVFPARGSI